MNTWIKFLFYSILQINDAPRNIPQPWPIHKLCQYLSYNPEENLSQFIAQIKRYLNVCHFEWPPEWNFVFKITFRFLSHSLVNLHDANSRHVKFACCFSTPRKSVFHYAFSHEATRIWQYYKSNSRNGSIKTLTSIILSVFCVKVVNQISTTSTSQLPNFFEESVRLGRTLIYNGPSLSSRKLANNETHQKTLHI